MKNKKREVLFLITTAAAVLFSGCRQNTNPSGLSEEKSVKAPTAAVDTSAGISASVTEENEAEDNENADVPKLVVDTEKPYMLDGEQHTIKNAEELYTVEKQEIDADLFNKYTFSEYFADGNYYCTEETPGKAFYDTIYGEDKEPVEKASIAVYNADTEDYSIIYSEAPKDDRYGLSFYIVGLYDSYLYYFRSEVQTFYEKGDLQLCRLNLDDCTSEKLFVFANENARFPDNPIRVGNFLYFYEVHDVDFEKGQGTWTIYSCDMNTGEVSVFRDNAEKPIPYKDGLVYYHDGGFYYHGNSVDVKGKGIFNEGDELIFYPNPDGTDKVSGININEDTAVYTYFIYDKERDGLALGSTFGVFDEDFNRTDIASTPVNSNAWYIDAEGCKICDNGLIAIDCSYTPLIYDTETKSFSVISDEYSFYTPFISEGALFFLGTDTDDEGKCVSAALYTVKKAKSDSAAATEPKSNPDVKPEITTEPGNQTDLDGRYGYIADADGNIIEYVPETVISENSYQAGNSMDLTDTKSPLRNKNFKKGIAFFWKILYNTNWGSEDNTPCKADSVVIYI